MDHHALNHVYSFVLTDINPHAKFQVAIITGNLKSTSYENLNLSLIGTCTLVRMDRLIDG